MLQIKEWFLSKNFSSEQAYAISNADRMEILKETEKAYQLKFVTEYGDIVSWVPKTCVFEAEQKTKKIVMNFSNGTKMEFDTKEERNEWYFKTYGKRL